MSITTNKSLLAKLDKDVNVLYNALDFSDNSWLTLTKSFLSNKYNVQFQDKIQNLVSTVRRERRLYTVYPKVHNTFKALELVDFEKVKVVVLGQDPYHSPPNAANGLAFSSGLPDFVPPSLENIYREIDNSVGKHAIWGEYHARQGVLLLNTALTVREKAPNSHAPYWEFFTSFLLLCLLKRRKPIGFMLWGSQASSYLDRVVNTNRLLDVDKKHLFLKTSHPSPMFGACNKGFLGCRHFAKINDWLIKQQSSTIDW